MTFINLTNTDPCPHLKRGSRLDEKHGIINNMEKSNFNPLVITAIVAGVVLIIALSLILTRGDSDTTETTNQSNVSESESEGGDQQRELPVPQPPEPAPVPLPTPKTDVLPPNWSELSSGEKIALNPFGCDVETQIIYADDGTCHPNPEIEEELSIEENELSIAIDVSRAELELTLDSSLPNDEKYEAIVKFCGNVRPADGHSSDDCVWISNSCAADPGPVYPPQLDFDYESFIQERCAHAATVNEFCSEDNWCGNRLAYDRMQELWADLTLQGFQFENYPSPNFDIPDGEYAVYVKHRARATAAQATVHYVFVK